MLNMVDAECGTLVINQGFPRVQDPKESSSRHACNLDFSNALEPEPVASDPRVIRSLFTVEANMLQGTSPTNIQSPSL
eukprot:c21245_g1_i1 orf=1-231(-)